MNVMVKARNRIAIELAVLVGSLLVAVGCGGSSSTTTTKNINAFVGAWDATSGAFEEVCPGGNNTSGYVTGTEAWLAGTSSDLTLTIPGSTCMIDADITNDTATGVQPLPSCTTQIPFSNGDAATEMYTFTAYSFIITSGTGASGSTAAETFSATEIDTDNVLNESRDCTFSQSVTYTKE